jgi:NAD(P)-dependent dehydrogenase (short-subunit alcohol dehydrogenase family)
LCENWICFVFARNSVPSQREHEKGEFRGKIMAEEKQSVPKIPSMRLDGKTAVVTGAGRGLGLGCAQALAEAGANTVLVSRTAAELEEACASIQAVGGKAEPLVCDVTDAAQVAEKIGGLSRIDVLVNNAGTNIPEPFLDVSEEHLDRVIDLNVKAMFFVSQAAARRMTEHGGGAIINMSSQMGHVGSPNRTAYCLTKHAVEGMTKAMAVELAPQKIRVNSLSPTFIRTPMTETFFTNEEFLNWTLDQIPLGRIGDIEDIMGAIVFLASPAAALITGTSLLVDGGWTAK